jgi:hypothetical protein
MKARPATASGRGGPGLGLISRPPQWWTAALLLADGPDSLQALAQGLPVPRSRLRPDFLALIDEPAVGPDYRSIPRPASPTKRSSARPG